jgi:hypothetical protein
MDKDSTELLIIRAKQLQLLELALRLSDGDPITASALLHSTGSRWSMEFLLDPLDLYEATTQAVISHLKRNDGK